FRPMSSHCCRMLRAGCSVSIMPRLVSTEGGSFFFQPLQFHLESPDLLIEFRFLRCLLLPLLSPVPLKDLLPFFQELFLPASYQRRVNLILAGDLADTFLLSRRFQRHLELEGLAVLTSFCRHLLPSTGL